MEKRKTVFKSLITFVLVYLANLRIDSFGTTFTWKLLFQSFFTTSIMCFIFYLGVLYVRKKEKKQGGSMKKKIGVFVVGIIVGLILSTVVRFFIP